MRYSERSASGQISASFDGHRLRKKSLDVSRITAQRLALVKKKTSSGIDGLGSIICKVRIWCRSGNSILRRLVWIRIKFYRLAGCRYRLKYLRTVIFGADGRWFCTATVFQINFSSSMGTWPVPVFKLY